MSFKCGVELTGGDTLLQEHSIVTVFAEKNGVITDRFSATVEDLVESGFVTSNQSDKTVYLKLKSYLAKKQH